MKIRKVLGEKHVYEGRLCSMAYHFSIYSCEQHNILINRSRYYSETIQYFVFSHLATHLKMTNCTLLKLSILNIVYMYVCVCVCVCVLVFFLFRTFKIFLPSKPLAIISLLKDLSCLKLVMHLY